MTRTSLSTILVVLAFGGVVGCSTSPSAPTDTLSDTLPALGQKVVFLERYVSFRRSYEQLDFHLTYQDNNGGMVPGPSDWDIRLVAVVPPAELVDWVPPNCPAVPNADVSWLDTVPNASNARSITEWYIEPRRVVGIDRKRSVVACRMWKY